MESVRASACSKVLVTGAYLIIDPKYRGLVLATDARFHAVSRLRQGADPSLLEVRVTSRQFRQTLGFTVRQGEIVSTSEGASPFLTKCITYLAMVARARDVRLDGHSLEVDLVGDNAFYS